MANPFLAIYEWINGYFVNFSGYLLTVIITVAFIFWGPHIFAFLEKVYTRVIRRRYSRKTQRMLDKAPHADSFLVFLIGALLVIPFFQGIIDYLISPILRTTSLLVFLIIAFVVFYVYYVQTYRPKLLRR
jgi:hypothetical protein